MNFIIFSLFLASVEAKNFQEITNEALAQISHAAKEKDDVKQLYGDSSYGAEVQPPQYEKPNYEKPNYEDDDDDDEKPAYDKPTYDKPTYDKPTYDKPSEEKPSYGKPQSSHNPVLYNQQVVVSRPSQSQVGKSSVLLRKVQEQLAEALKLARSSCKNVEILSQAGQLVKVVLSLAETLGQNKEEVSKLTVQH